VTGRVLFVDPFAGVAGDMFCAALIDLGADLAAIRAELARLDVGGFQVSAPRTRRGALAAQRFLVKPDSAPKAPDPDHRGRHHGHEAAPRKAISPLDTDALRPPSCDALEVSRYDSERRTPVDPGPRRPSLTRGRHQADHGRLLSLERPDHSHDHRHDLSEDHSHEHGHAHGEEHGHTHGDAHSHTHGHDHQHRHQHWPGQPDRTWREISALISEAGFATRVRERALAVFGLLAEAEGRVHGVPPAQVRFHEVGAVDSIVDIVGACVGLELLDVSHIVCGPLPLSSGHTQSAHGLIPLPAPATLELLAGWPTRPGVPGMEQVTPTGAALISALAEPGDLPAMTVVGVGYGAGTRDLPDRPNVLRAVLGRPSRPASAREVAVLEAQMDDLPGEHLPPLRRALEAAGAIDVIAIPVLMKKARSGVLVQALARPHEAADVEAALLRHGSTFGVRRTLATRRVLDRWHERAETPWGPVRIKVGALDGEVVQIAPEFEDVDAVARRSGVPVPRVHRMALRAAAEPSSQVLPSSTQPTPNRSLE